MDDDLVQSQVEELLRQKIGLNPDSVGSRSILRAVRKGMRSGKMQATSDYLKGLQETPEVFKALVESVVVPETSFFRNRASFVFLRQWIAQEWLKRAVKRPIRVLSIPCSTGEEPYSIAIALREEGLAFDEFCIDAVDISEQAIAKAKKGVYSPYAFRRQTYRSDDKYFTLKTPQNYSGTRSVQRYHLNKEIRESVTFIQGNLLSEGLLAHRPLYDVIFCRNLLIYFDAAARDCAMAFFDRMLRPQGLLFLGYAETGLIDTKCYKPVPYPQTFAYSRQPNTFAAQPSSFGVSYNESTSEPRSHLESCAVKDRAVEDCAVKEPRTFREVSARKVPSQPDLAIAQQLADSGDIERAVEQCELYMQYRPADAKAHLLRGELYQARDDLSAAESCFEKAIYLDSQLVEALVHLMLIRESQGFLTDVEVLRERIRRLEKMTD